MCFHNLHQADALAHGEVHFVLMAGDHIERRLTVKMDRSEINIRREDANPAGEASQISSRRFILVALLHIHRMERMVFNECQTGTSGSVLSKIRESAKYGSLPSRELAVQGKRRQQDPRI